MGVKGSKTTIESIFDRLEKVNGPLDTQCWVWTGCIGKRGYAVVGWNKKLRGVHRIVYEYLVKPVPNGLELDHLCRNRACANPDHLEPVTHAENVRRGKGGENMRSKTHCPQGHPYDRENTHIGRQGERHCKTCHRNRAREYYRAHIKD